jgi:AcrR family transcriptional regulator
VGRRDEIHAAAIEQSTRCGIASTTMANIAEAAGLSRSARYQYFCNKADIFASAFVAVFEPGEERPDRSVDRRRRQLNVGGRGGSSDQDPPAAHAR